MIVIEEKDFTSGAYSNDEFRYHIKKGFTKEEKQQILQNREDAKKWFRLINRPNNTKFEQWISKIILESKKDKQIVKKLEEEKIDNEKYHSCKNIPEKICTACVVNVILQKILKGKNDS